MLASHASNLQRTVIDLHCHVLPAIDDGPATIEESIALAKLAAENGIQTLLATPHVNRHYANESKAIARLVESLNDRLQAKRIDVDLRAGAEIEAAQIASIATEELQCLGLNGGPWLLVEPPFSTDVRELPEILASLQSRDARVLLAHPERCPGLHRDPRMLRELVSGGVRTSITAGSLTGRFGLDVRRFSLALAEEELIHNVASDAHDISKRPPSIAKELEQAGLGMLAEWLTQEVPAAILAGERSIPPRPPAKVTSPRSQRGRWRRALER
jgi:protein-tyrosine phosphatase